MLLSIVYAFDVNEFSKEPGVTKTSIYNVPTTKLNNFMSGFKYHKETVGYPWWFGFKAETTYDMTLGYHAEFFHMLKDAQNWLVLHPGAWA